MSCHIKSELWMLCIINPNSYFLNWVYSLCQYTPMGEKEREIERKLVKEHTMNPNEQNALN